MEEQTEGKYERAIIGNHQSHESLYKMTSQDKLRAKRRQVKVRIQNLIILFSAFYIVYACLHYYGGHIAGCSNHSILMTLFPVRQLYFIPTVEQVWAISTASSLSGQDDIAGALGAEFAELLKYPIMDVIRYGSCADLYRLTGLVDPKHNQSDRKTSPVMLTRAARATPSTPVSRGTPVNVWDIIGTPTPIVRSRIRVSSTDTEGSCFPHDRAYVTGKMNIRESPTTSSLIVDTANEDDLFEVSEVKQGETWCWLKIPKGWMAFTRFVSPVVSDIVPTIEGEP